MNKYHEVNNLKFIQNQLIIEIDGEEKIYDLDEISESLKNASDTERMKYEISPSGYGIHWHLLDEDISIDGLLGIVHKPEWGSFEDKRMEIRNELGQNEFHY